MKLTTNVTLTDFIPNDWIWISALKFYKIGPKKRILASLKTEYSFPFYSWKDQIDNISLESIFRSKVENQINKLNKDLESRSFLLFFWWNNVFHYLYDKLVLFDVVKPRCHIGRAYLYCKLVTFWCDSVQ